MAALLSRRIAGTLGGVCLLLLACLQTVAAATAPDTTAVAKQRSFTVGVGAYTNSTFFGRSQTEKFPYWTTELTYKAPSGAWVSALNYDLFSTTTLRDETDLSVGWDKDFTQRLDGSLSYSHFFFSPNSPLLKSAVSNSLDGYVGLDWGFLYTRLNADYVFGEAQDFFLVLDNSRYFEIDNVLMTKGILSFEPRVSVMAGTQSFVTTSIEQQLNRKGKGRPGGTGTTSNSTSTRFSLLNYELRVPVTYSLGKVSVEAAWRYLRPVHTLADDTSRPLSIFSGGVYVTF
ncbi:hypothetical protein [Hymenobacter sp. BT730]|uniref:hypothetical protein n=1 Tax=Hymenobacter sp. BT730 TaxID=3063332 RepID=UPI0026DF459A|nr:hypothetical protein [Hymenobacter sp. BT730]